MPAPVSFALRPHSNIERRRRITGFAMNDFDLDFACGYDFALGCLLGLGVNLGSILWRLIPASGAGGMRYLLFMVSDAGIARCSLCCGRCARDPSLGFCPGLGFGLGQYHGFAFFANAGEEINIAFDTCKSSLFGLIQLIELVPVDFALRPGRWPAGTALHTLFTIEERRFGFGIELAAQIPQGPGSPASWHVVKLRLITAFRPAGFGVAREVAAPNRKIDWKIIAVAWAHADRAIATSPLRRPAFTLPRPDFTRAIKRLFAAVVAQPGAIAV